MWTIIQHLANRVQWSSNFSFFPISKFYGCYLSYCSILQTSAGPNTSLTMEGYIYEFLLHTTINNCQSSQKLQHITFNSHMTDGTVEGEASAVETLRTLGGLPTVNTFCLELYPFVRRWGNVDVLHHLSKIIAGVSFWVWQWQHLELLSSTLIL